MKRYNFLSGGEDNSKLTAANAKPVSGSFP